MMSFLQSHFGPKAAGDKPSRPRPDAYGQALQVRRSDPPRDDDLIPPNSVKVGEGTFGVVYKYTSSKDGKVHARKLRKKDGVNHILQFVSEGHLAKFFGGFGVGPKVYEYSSRMIDMEYFPMTLSDFLLTSPSGMTPELWKKLQMLYYRMITVGYVCYDQKPNNVVYNPDTGDMKLIDFGQCAEKCDFVARMEDFIYDNQEQLMVQSYRPEETSPKKYVVYMLLMLIEIWLHRLLKRNSVSMVQDAPNLFSKSTYDTTEQIILMMDKNTFKYKLTYDFYIHSVFIPRNSRKSIDDGNISGYVYINGNNGSANLRYVCNEYTTGIVKHFRQFSGSYKTMSDMNIVPRVNAMNKYFLDLEYYSTPLDQYLREHGPNSIKDAWLQLYNMYVNMVNNSMFCADQVPQNVLYKKETNDLKFKYVADCYMFPYIIKEVEDTRQYMPEQRFNHNISYYLVYMMMIMMELNMLSIKENAIYSLNSDTNEFFNPGIYLETKTIIEYMDESTSFFKMTYNQKKDMYQL